jgi:hypothetical protein
MESNYYPTLLYPAKLSFLIEGEAKIFYNKEKTKGICDHQVSTTEDT